MTNTDQQQAMRLKYEVVLHKHRVNLVKGVVPHWNNCEVEVLLKYITELQAALANQVAVWRPIEDAPRDGTEVLLDFGFIDYYGRHIANGWHSNRAWRSYEIVTGDPIAWMPLPPAPPIADGGK